MSLIDISPEDHDLVNVLFAIRKLQWTVPLRHCLLCMTSIDKGEYQRIYCGLSDGNLSIIDVMRLRFGYSQSMLCFVYSIALRSTRTERSLLYFNWSIIDRGSDYSSRSTMVFDINENQCTQREVRSLIVMTFFIFHLDRFQNLRRSLLHPFNWTNDRLSYRHFRSWWLYLDLTSIHEQHTPSMASVVASASGHHLSKQSLW